MSAGRPRQMRFFLPAFMLWLFGAVVASFSARAEDSHVPLEPISCPSEAVQGEDVVCFLFHVPSDWNDISNRPMVLPVMRFAPLGAEASKPPLLILGGGPGQSVILLQKNIVKNLKFLRQDREIILMDQRGTGPMSEALFCTDALGENEMVDSEALASCVKSAEASGLRLSDYSTGFAVEDYRALRYALGIDKWAIIASSYGARVAQGLIRRDEKGIDRIVFNGPLFLATKLFDWSPIEKIDEVIESCNEDDPCRTAFPDLYWDYQRLPFAMSRAKLEESAVIPASAQAFFYGKRLTSLLAQNKAGAVPADIAATTLSLDKALADKTIWTPPDPLPQSMKNISLLMHFALSCAEDINRLADQSSLDLKQPLTVEFYRQACETLGQKASNVIKLEKGWDKGSKSSRPVLILNGELDPIVMPEKVADSLSLFSNAAWVKLPFGGHDVFSNQPCVRQIAEAFLAGGRPDALDTSCAEKREPSFVLKPQFAKK